MLRKKIRVLYPVLHYPPIIGGLEQWEQNIAARQTDDVITTVVTGKVKNVPCYEKRGNVEILHTSLFTLQDVSHSPVTYIVTTVPFIFFRSLVLASRNKVDIFHCHGFVSAIMGYVLCFFTGKPFIGTEQSIIWQNTFKKLVCGIIYRKATMCIAASRAVAEEFKKIGVREIEIIPNGVDLEKFSREHCLKCAGFHPPHVGGETPHINILSVGRLEKVKGHTYLIEAFAKIKKEIPNSLLTLVGNGSERKALEKQAEDLGIMNEVQFTGEIPHEELPHWYHRADVFIMPSLSEGFGIAVIEAMACGLPVVVSSTGGLLDIVEDKVTGFLSSPGDYVSLKHHILNILKNKDLQKTFSNNARCHASKYSWNNIAQKVSNIYKSTLARKEEGHSFC